MLAVRFPSFLEMNSQKDHTADHDRIKSELRFFSGFFVFAGHVGSNSIANESGKM